MTESLMNAENIQSISDCIAAIEAWKRHIMENYSVDDVLVVFQFPGDNLLHQFAENRVSYIKQNTIWYSKIEYAVAPQNGQFVEDNGGRRWLVFGFELSEGILGLALKTSGEASVQSELAEAGQLFANIKIVGNLYSALAYVSILGTFVEDYRTVESVLARVASLGVEDIVATLNQLVTKTLFDFHYSIVSLYYPGEQRIRSVGYDINSIYLPKEEDVKQNVKETTVPIWYPDIVSDTVLQANNNPQWNGYYIPGTYHPLFDRVQWEELGHKDLVRLFAPIRSSARPIGVIEVSYDLTFDSSRSQIAMSDQERLKVILDRFGLALSSAQLLGEKQAEIDYLSRISALQTLRSLAISVETALTEAKINSENYFFRVIESDFSYETDSAGTFAEDLKSNVLKNVQEIRRTILVGTNKEDGRRYFVDSRQIDPIPALLRHEPTPLSWIAVPLIADGSVIGCFGLMEKEHEYEVFEDTSSSHPNFGIYDVHYLESLAEHVSRRIKQLNTK